MSATTKRRPAAPMQSPPEPVSSSAALRDLLDRKRAELAEATQHRDALVARRGDVGLEHDGDEAAIRAHHQACALAEQREQYLAAACATLEQRIVEAEKVEHRANIEAAKLRMIDGIAKGKAVKVRYVARAREAAGELAELQSLQEAYDADLKIVERGGAREEIAELLGFDFDGPACTDAFGSLVARGAVVLPAVTGAAPIWGRIRGDDRTAPRYVPTPAAPDDGHRGIRILDAEGRDVSGQHGNTDPLPLPPVRKSAVRQYLERSDAAHGW